MLTVLLVFFTLKEQELFLPLSLYKSADECYSAEKFLDKTDLVPVGATQISTQCIEFDHPGILEDFDHEPTKEHHWNW